MSFISMFSPIPLFMEVIKTGNTKKIPNFAFQSASIMLLGWVSYAYVINNMELLKASSMSLIALTLYATLAYILKKEIIKLFIFYVVLAVLAVVYTNIPPSFLGTISAVSQVAAASANLELIVKIYIKFKFFDQSNFSIFNNFCSSYLNLRNLGNFFFKPICSFFFNYIYVY